MLHRTINLVLSFLFVCGGQVCGMVVDCRRLPFAKHPINGCGRADEFIVVFHIVLGLCFGPLHLPCCVSRSLVYRSRSSRCESTPRAPHCHPKLHGKLLSPNIQFIATFKGRSKHIAYGSKNVGV